MREGVAACQLLNEPPNMFLTGCYMFLTVMST